MFQSKEILTNALEAGAKTFEANNILWSKGAMARDARLNRVPVTSPEATCFCIVGMVAHTLGIGKKEVKDLLSEFSRNNVEILDKLGEKYRYPKPSDLWYLLTHLNDSVIWKKEQAIQIMKEVAQELKGEA